MQSSRITLKEIELTKESDRGFRVLRAGIDEVGAEFEHRVAFQTKRVAQRAEIDQLKDIARDRTARGISEIAAGSDKTQLAIADRGLIAAPTTRLIGESML